LSKKIGEGVVKEQDLLRLHWNEHAPNRLSGNSASAGLLVVCMQACATSLGGGSGQCLHG
jgi:hypothetical protein